MRITKKIYTKIIVTAAIFLITGPLSLHASTNPCPEGKVLSLKENLSNAKRLSSCGIIVHREDQSLYRFEDGILRQEVIGMAVKMRGFELPESYWCQNYYFDVTQSIPNNWICRAGEIAADHFVISRENGHLRPMETVTRAEAVAMMLSASCMRPVTPQQAQQVMQIKSYEFTTDTVDWQRRTLIRYDGIAPINTFHFEPNACSTRSEVFDFAVTFLDHTTDGNNCRSTLCDIVDTLERAAGEPVGDGFLTNVDSVDDIIQDARSSGEAFFGVEKLDDIADILREKWESFQGVETFEDTLEVIGSDPLYSSANSIADVIGISESYEQFVEAVSEAVPTLEHIETIDDFIETVNEIQGYEQIVSIGELITDLQETSESFSDVVNVEDLQEVIENHTELESLGEILAVTSLAGLVDETLDAAESTVQEIVEEITNINGFAEVESIDDFIQELSQSPGFQSINDIEDINNIVVNFGDLGSLEEIKGAVALSSFLDENFDVLVDDGDDLLELIQDQTGFRDIRTVDDFIKRSSVSLPGLEDIQSFDVFDEFLEGYEAEGTFDDITTGAELGNLIDESFDIGEDGLGGLIEVVNEQPGFQEVEGIAEFMTEIRKLPGFGSIQDLTGLIEKLSQDYSSFGDFGNRLAAVQLSTMGDAFTDIDHPNDVVNFFQEDTQFAETDSIDDVLDELSNYAAFASVDSFPKFVETLQSYPELDENITHVSDIVTTLGIYDEFALELLEFSFFSGTQTPGDIIDRMRQVPGFEHINSIADLVEGLKLHYSYIFDQNDNVAELIDKFDDINRLLENTQLQ